MLGLFNKYDIDSTLAEQDWFTLLGWELSDLFYTLPCEFNIQTHTEYKNEFTENIWESYRNCSSPVKILHNNGSI